MSSSSINPAGSAAIDGKVRVGDVLSAVDGVEVRGGCRSVANVIQANKDLPSHTLVLLRKKPPEMERAAHKDLTVRLDLGGATLLGLKADNANVIVEIYDGGVAGLDGRLQIGDQILSVDMNAVHAGNVKDALALGTTVHDLVVRRDAKALAKQQQTATQPLVRRGSSLSSLPADAELAKFTVAMRTIVGPDGKRRLGIGLDSRNLITEISAGSNLGRRRRRQWRRTARSKVLSCLFRGPSPQPDAAAALSAAPVVPILRNKPTPHGGQGPLKAPSARAATCISSAGGSKRGYLHPKGSLSDRSPPRPPVYVGNRRPAGYASVSPAKQRPEAASWAMPLLFAPNQAPLKCSTSAPRPSERSGSSGLISGSTTRRVKTDVSKLETIKSLHVVEAARGVSDDATPRGTPIKKGGAMATVSYFEQFWEDVPDSDS